MSIDMLRVTAVICQSSLARRETLLFHAPLARSMVPSCLHPQAHEAEHVNEFEFYNLGMILGFCRLAAAAAVSEAATIGPRRRVRSRWYDFVKRASRCGNYKSRQTGEAPKLMRFNLAPSDIVRAQVWAFRHAASNHSNILTIL